LDAIVAISLFAIASDSSEKCIPLFASDALARIPVTVKGIVDARSEATVPAAAPGQVDSIVFMSMTLPR
jgi:hypothetical protein